MSIGRFRQELEARQGSCGMKETLYVDNGCQIPPVQYALFPSSTAAAAHINPCHVLALIWWNAITATSQVLAQPLETGKEELYRIPCKDLASQRLIVASLRIRYHLVA